MPWTPGQQRPGRQVLVVGAGIAGPALAFWLHRAGFAVTVCGAITRGPPRRAGGRPARDRPRGGRPDGPRPRTSGGRAFTPRGSPWSTPDGAVLGSQRARRVERRRAARRDRDPARRPGRRAARRDRSGCRVRLRGPGHRAAGDARRRHGHVRARRTAAGRPAGRGRRNSTRPCARSPSATTRGPSATSASTPRTGRRRTTSGSGTGRWRTRDPNCRRTSARCRETGRRSSTWRSAPPSSPSTTATSRRRSGWCASAPAAWAGRYRSRSPASTTRPTSTSTPSARSCSSPGTAAGSGCSAMRPSPRRR